ncbi:aminotransferase-like domain-containing protein [Paraburkholderia silvatlantica]|uniref:DNA-binding transcriptional MocR family regulator n=1 Tax=Paraburkholderia silvatlantica TaxID=321895 RepID=A0A2U1A9G2_9BURK|nr:PLP-dependent aminotransferase family protein [Paraburkholderia silvatlantica]MBB2930479.1 DNA-binding transcriptional MocR family regulator [Paraburkholderia silvatlantica]PVY30287.1 GntR family transcriptional regulator [Paraburkholderia silvatlantica]PXW36977.1 GntR family transcriptional regulator [Paraburkholderia silvatlantica]PYE21308.1 GntR family transcriptional regulator [Paraburkholderia silvatlantica]TDQ86551.1 GntR family transcriptional regulator [Paraburkholderia silvatlantic
MKINLDAGSSLSLTEQIVGQIEALIRDGRLHAGEKLWSIRQLAAEQQISRFPILEAYDRLVNRGLLYSRHGSGYYVADSVDLERSIGGVNPDLAAPESNQVREQFASPDYTLNLSIGLIPEAWRDVDGITQAIRQAMRKDSRSLIDYATPQGDAGLRSQIQQRLRFFGLAVEPQSIMLTDSASEALDLVVRLILKPGDTVFVEDPGYFNLFGLLKMQGIRLIGIRRLPTGPDIDVVEDLLKENKPKVFFVNTALHNPTGSNVAPNVGFRLLQLAHEHDFMIVEDDVFADFQSIPSARLAALDRLNRVIYVGGFSKSLSSSLRLGYLVATADRINRLVDVKVLTRLGGTRFSERVTAALLEHGAYRKHLDRLRRRVNGALSTALGHLHDAGWEVLGEPCGGTLIWAKFPGIDNSEVMVNEAAKLGIALQPGSYHRPNGEATPWIRFNTAHLNDERAIRFLRAMKKG